MGRKVGRIREGLPEDVASEQDHKGQMEGYMNGKGGKHNPGKENRKEKKQTKISKDTACSGSDKSTDVWG